MNTIMLHECNRQSDWGCRVRFNSLVFEIVRTSTCYREEDTSSFSFQDLFILANIPFLYINDLKVRFRFFHQLLKRKKSKKV